MTFDTYYIMAFGLCCLFKPSLVLGLTSNRLGLERHFFKLISKKAENASRKKSDSCVEASFVGDWNHRSRWPGVEKRVFVFAADNNRLKLKTAPQQFCFPPFSGAQKFQVGGETEARTSAKREGRQEARKVPNAREPVAWNLGGQTY